MRARHEYDPGAAVSNVAAHTGPINFDTYWMCAH
ncbi:hypothetical protein JOE11_003607 [Robbsia andropogonis]